MRTVCRIRGIRNRKALRGILVSVSNQFNYFCWSKDNTWFIDYNDATSPLGPTQWSSWVVCNPLLCRCSVEAKQFLRSRLVFFFSYAHYLWPLNWRRRRRRSLMFVKFTSFVLSAPVFDETPHFALAGKKHSSRRWTNHDRWNKFATAPRWHIDKWTHFSH